MKPYRRKLVNLTIKSRLQARLLGRIGLLLLVCVATGAAVFYLAGSHELGGSLRMAHLRIHRVEDLLLPVLGLTGLLALIIGAAVSLLLPLHIVGPLPRLEAALRRTGAGDLRTRIDLRNGDLLEELGGAFNGMTAGLRARILSLKGQVDSLGREAERLRELAEARPELRDAVEPISLVGRQLSHELAGFQVAD